MEFGGGPHRRWGAVLIASMSVLAMADPAGAAQAASGPAGVKAKSAYLLDSRSNRAVWSRSPDTARQMASTTKVMTAVVVLDTPGVNLDRRITVKKAYRRYVAKTGASTADLRTGDKLTVRQLLYGLMLPSGCDAAYALADAFGAGGTVGARTRSFIARMKRKAASLSMRSSHFDSFDGISRGGRNYSTPRDLAKLVRHALGNRTFGTVVKATSTRQKATNGRTYTWYNTNRLLGSYRGAIGVKTGTGSAAGPCLVFAAERGGRIVVGVILNDAARYPDARKMLDWAYSSRTTMKLRRLPEQAQRD